MEWQTLNTGAKFPTIGFGTWQIPDGEDVIEAVLYALSVGYRLIDTARIYGNEVGVGKAIRNCDVPREDIIVTTKLWNDDHGYDSALRAFDASLSRLGLEYIDLYLIHWPDGGRRVEAWRALVEIYKSGRAKAIGVSNFTSAHIAELLEQSDVVPAVNQIVFHPFVYKDQVDTLEFCEKNNITVEAYSPLTRGRQIENPVISQIAAKYSKTGAQVMLRWAMQHSTIPIPKSSTPERIKENFEVFDFELTRNDMKVIDNLS